MRSEHTRSRQARSRQGAQQARRAASVQRTEDATKGAIRVPFEGPGRVRRSQEERLQCSDVIVRAVLLDVCERLTDVPPKALAIVHRAQQPQLH